LDPISVAIVAMRFERSCARRRRLLAIGVIIGVAGARLSTWYIEAQLFGVTATDPVTFVLACVVLAMRGSPRASSPPFEPCTSIPSRFSGDRSRAANHAGSTGIHYTGSTGS
jgi:hypothetical protein